MALAAAALGSTAARALPAFARKTGLACSACHEAWPRLNDFGQRFRDDGYRLRQARDAPVESAPGYLPLALRASVGYQWLRSTLVASDSGPVTTQTGTFGFTGLDVHAGGTLGEKVSFLVTYTPGLKDASFRVSPSDGDLEAAWVGLNDLFGTSWLNLRVGKHALDLPEDEHRQTALTAPFASYHFHVPGGADGFEPGDNQSGLEVHGHSLGPAAVRYSVSLFNAAGAPPSNHVISSPALYARASWQALFDGELFASLRLGLSGAAGWQATAQVLSGGAPLAGTGSALASWRRAGADAKLSLLDRFFPLSLSGAIYAAWQDAALVQGATARASWLGGFLELAFSPDIHHHALLRLERIGVTAAGSPDAPAGAGDRTVLAAVVRRTLEISSRTELALHLEASYTTAATGADSPSTTAALAALDFAF